MHYGFILYEMMTSFFRCVIDSFATGVRAFVSIVLHLARMAFILWHCETRRFLKHDLMSMRATGYIALNFKLTAKNGVLGLLRWLSNVSALAACQRQQLHCCLDVTSCQVLLWQSVKVSLQTFWDHPLTTGCAHVTDGTLEPGAGIILQHLALSNCRHLVHSSLHLFICLYLSIL